MFRARNALSGVTTLCLAALIYFSHSPATLAAAARQPEASAEARLLHIYELIGAGRAREALPMADALARDYPNFKLAHLVRGDLLLSQTRSLPRFAAVPDDITRQSQAIPAPSLPVSADNTGQKNLLLSAPKLEELKEEALLRMRALREQPPANSLPQAFVQLASITRNVLLVDLSRSRLYHYAQGENGSLKLSASYYVTQGRLGAEKIKEGDERTPLGIYYITENINKRRLDSFYGAGALAINFPNEFDKRRNRSGSGIWLHGVPNGDRGTFARVPKSSNGCLVLANPDLLKLISTIKPGETPIVITNKATWLTAAEWQAQHAAMSRYFDNWTAARTLPNDQTLRGFYSSSFSSYGTPLDAWLAKNAELHQTAMPQHVTLLYYPGADEFMVATFYDAAKPSARGGVRLTRKRQYWHKVNGSWKIFFEGALGV